MPFAIFEDIIEVDVEESATEIQLDIDPVFIDVCEEDSLKITGLVPNTACVVGGEIINKKIILKISSIRAYPSYNHPFPSKIIIKISGVRKDRGVRFPKYSEEEAVKNNTFWDSWKK
jgi:hypothetical protein